MIELSDIDNGIFESIRKEIVRKGYLPDINDFLPSTPENEDLWEAALTSIRTSGKQIINVFNVGDSDDRDAIDKNKIIVDRLIPEKGNIGLHCVQELIASGDPEDEETFYKKVSPPPYTYFINYQVTYICKKTKYDYILAEIIRKAVQNFTFLKGYSDEGIETAEGFNIRYINTIDTSGEDFIEKMYRFKVGEVILDDYKTEDAFIIENNIPQITDIAIDNVATNEITDDLLIGESS